jgi:hypothetical protein
VLPSAFLLVAGMTSISLANWTDYHNPYFKVVEAGSNHAWFSLTWGISGDCDAIDENCAVKVTGTPSTTTGDPVARWVDELSTAKTRDIGCSLTFDRDTDRYAEFEDCMEVQKTGFTVHWPTITPDDAFEITPFCKPGDEVCAVKLRVCFNAADCADNNHRKRRWSQVGDVWDDLMSEFRPSCLYNDDEDDVWECINDEFQDWLVDDMLLNGDYDDLVDQDEDERGFVVIDYRNDLNDVNDRSIPFRRYETLPEQNQRQSTPTAVLVLTPTPTAAQPTVSHAAPQDTPLPAVPVTNAASNLRKGPGTAYQVVGQLDAGTSLTPVARNGDGTWLQLDVGVWIWASLVNNIPVDLPHAANIPQLPAPTSTPEPTATPQPALTPTPAPTAVPTATPVVNPPPTATPTTIRLFDTPRQSTPTSITPTNHGGGDGCDGSGEHLTPDSLTTQGTWIDVLAAQVLIGQTCETDFEYLVAAPYMELHGWTTSPAKPSLNVRGSGETVNVNLPVSNLYQGRKITCRQESEPVETQLPITTVAVKIEYTTTEPTTAWQWMRSKVTGSVQKGETHFCMAVAAAQGGDLTKGADLSFDFTELDDPGRYDVTIRVCTNEPISTQYACYSSSSKDADSGFIQMHGLVESLVAR